MTYPCFGEPLPIRPFDKEELEKLQKASPPPLTSFSSGLGNGMVNGGGAVDIVFEGFSDMSKLSLSFSEGTTLGEFKSALVQQKGVDPRGIKVLERVNGSETEMLDQSAVLSIDSLSKGSDYMIKVVNSNVGGKGLSHAAVHDFDALGHRALSDSRDFGEGGARRMIIPEFQDSKITKYEKLGSGAFGSVWRVGFEGFTCAMKVLTITDKTDSYDIESLKMETEILEKANHKNIVRYLGHEFREKEMRVFLEFVPFSLRGLLDQMQAQSLSPQTAKKIMVNVARGINYMHNLSPPIIHRDIKSANILCVKDEEGGVEVAKLCDFGVSKLVEEENQVGDFFSFPPFFLFFFSHLSERPKPMLEPLRLWLLKFAMEKEKKSIPLLLIVCLSYSLRKEGKPIFFFFLVTNYSHFFSSSLFVGDCHVGNFNPSKASQNHQTPRLVRTRFLPFPSPFSPSFLLSSPQNSTPFMTSKHNAVATTPNSDPMPNKSSIFFPLCTMTKNYFSLLSSFF